MTKLTVPVGGWEAPACGVTMAVSTTGRLTSAGLGDATSAVVVAPSTSMVTGALSAELSVVMVGPMTPA
jgi:hypothetical protein